MIYGDLITAIVAAVRGARPDITVSDGPGVMLQNGILLEVGVDLPRSRAVVLSAQGSTEWATVGRLRKETGEISCVTTSWRGSTDMSAARADVEAVQATIEVLIRDDPRWAVDGVLKTGISGFRFRQVADGNAVAAQLALDISYTTAAR